MPPSEEVWFRTHRMAGPLFVAGGMAMMVVLLFAHRPAVMVGALVVIGAVVAVLPIIYSYVIYRKLDAAAPRESRVTQRELRPVRASRRARTS